MKKFKLGMALVLTASMLLLSACGDKKDSTSAETEATTTAKTEAATEEGPGKEVMVGGWSVNDSIIKAVLTDESKKAFDAAMESYNGIAMEPAALLATQVVAGTNYTFIAKAKEIPENALSGWYFVVVYQDPQGASSVTSAKEISITEPKTTQDAKASGELSGGIEVVDVKETGTLPEDVSGYFAKAAEKNMGLELTPVALLGSQVVAGKNYKILCQGATVTAEPVKSLYFVTLYVDPQHEAEFSSIDAVDIAAYTHQ